MIAETGSAPDRRKARWVTDTLRTARADGVDARRLVRVRQGDRLAPVGERGGRGGRARCAASAAGASAATRRSSSAPRGARRQLHADRVPGGLELDQRLQAGERVAVRPAGTTRLTVSAASSSIVAASRVAGRVDDRVDVAVPAQRREKLVHAPGHQVQHAARDVGDARDLAEVQRAQRRAARDDRDDGVARGQRRARPRGSGRAGRLVGREHGDDAGRLGTREARYGAATGLMPPITAGSLSVQPA